MFKKNVDYKGKFQMNIWRKLALNSWRSPKEGAISARVVLNPEKAIEYVNEINSTTDVKITLTHFVLKICGDLLEKFPEINATIRGSKVYQRSSCDLFVHVSKVGKDGKEDLTGYVIRSINEKSMALIARELNKAAMTIKEGDDITFKKVKSIFKLFPDFLIKPLMFVMQFIQYRLNIWSPFFGTQQDSFGAMMLTNIGVFGIKEAIVPHVPYTSIHNLCAMGVISDVPVVKDGQVVAGKEIVFTWTIDHRLVDGSAAGKMMKVFKERFENPYGK